MGNWHRTHGAPCRACVAARRSRCATRPGPRGMVTVVDDARRLVPRTDAVLADPRLAAAEVRLGRSAGAGRGAPGAAAGQGRRDRPGRGRGRGRDRLPPLAASLTPVLNATGVLLHTNLGRAPLSAAARDPLAAAAGCTDLEFDLATGARGRRGAAMLAALARAVPDAQAVHVVNNNAAALVLAATALAAGREIVVSRGELIEIGDGFRLPELLASTGAHDPRGRQHEPDVGRPTTPPRSGSEPDSCSRSTRRTTGSRGSPPGERRRAGRARRAGGRRHRLRAARAAPGAARGAGRGDLAAGRRRPGHRQRRQAARRPAGRAAARPRRPDQALARHPLARALRVDKLTAAALEATLTGPTAPVLRALSADHGAGRPGRTARCACWPPRDWTPGRWPARPRWGAAVRPGWRWPARRSACQAGWPCRCAPGSRCGPVSSPPSSAGSAGGRLLLDLYAVEPADDAVLAAAVVAAARRAAGPG